MRESMDEGAIEPSSSTGAGIDPARARRPAVRERLGAVALYFGYRALAALLLATPPSVLAAGIVGGDPRGDALLFEPGGLMLLEAGRAAAVAAAPLAAQLGVGALLVAAVGLIPLAALIDALSRAAPASIQATSGRVARALGPLALLWGAALAAEVAAAALVLLPGMKLCASLALTPRGRDLAALGVAAAALVPVAALGVLHDLARVAAVAEQRGLHAAVTRGLAALLASPLAAAWAYAWRGALVIIALACGAWGMHVVGVSTGPRVAVAFGAGLAALAVAALLRASWLAAAVRLLDRAAPAEDAGDDGRPTAGEDAAR
ncbi:hypothetical protein [Sorangium cellulosum]|nr:hypothetical protein [Sorangium cellulosum]